MNRTMKPWAGLCLAIVMAGGVGAAVAQEPGPPPATPAATPPAREISGQQEVTLPPQEMLQRAQGFLPEMRKSRAAVAEQLAEAKKKNDVVKTLCLDDKVKQMTLATDTAQTRVVDLASAVSQNDSDRAKHEFTVVQVLRDRVTTLVAEAQQCIGEETGFVGDTTVTVDIDPAIPDGRDSEFPDDPLVSEPPVLSSPTL